jgi:hypothetical protein
MNKDTQDIIQIFFTVLVIIFSFFAAFVAARWSRKKNLELNRSRTSSSERAELEALKQGKNPYAFSEYWAGNVAPWKAILGNIAAVIVIILFLAFIIFVAFIVEKII